MSWFLRWLGQAIRREKRKAASLVFCPKCNSELTLEIAVNTSPNGIPLYPRFCCQKCQIGSYDGKEWWTPKGRWFPRKEAKLALDSPRITWYEPEDPESAVIKCKPYPDRERPKQ